MASLRCRGSSLLGRGASEVQAVRLSRAYLEDGVISILAGTMPRGMAPGDIEAFLFPIDPLKPRVLAAVHLGHQPGLQPYAAGRRKGSGGRLVHGKAVCQREQRGSTSACQLAVPCSRGRVGAWGGRGMGWAVRAFPSSSTGGRSHCRPSRCSSQFSSPATSFPVTGSLHVGFVFGGKEGGGVQL